MEILEQSEILNELVDISRKPVLSDAPSQIGSEVGTAARGIKKIAKGIGKASVFTAKKAKRGLEIQKAKQSVKRGVATGRITPSHLEHSDILKDVVNELTDAPEVTPAPKKGIRGALHRRKAFKAGMRKLVRKELQTHDIQRAKFKAKKIKTRKVLKGTYRGPKLGY